MHVQFNRYAHTNNTVLHGFPRHVQCSDQGLLYILNTKADYPQRIAADCLKECSRTVRNGIDLFEPD